jgi:hypothetical protein
VVVFEGIIGSIIWTLANILYVDLKRKGKPGWSRIILFWMGIPLTWLWLFIVPEGSAPEIEEMPDDADAILAEIRRDRRLRPGSSPTVMGEPPPRRTPEEGPENEENGPTPG